MKRLLLFFFSLLSIVVVNAQSFSIEREGGQILWFSITGENTCSLGNEWGYGISYSGDLEIPSEVEYNGSVLSVTSIRAGLGFSKTKHITIPSTINDIQSIGTCDSLVSISVDPSNEYYTSINGVLFSKDLKVLVKYPTVGCDTLFIQDMTETISSNALGQTYYTPLRHIEVGKNNKMYTSVDGILYDKNVTELLICPAKKEGSLKIPETVVTIGPNAFKYSKLYEIIMTDNVKTLGEECFYSTSNLLRLVLSDNIETIPNSCFTYLPVKSLYLPKNLKKIGSSAFFSSELKSIVFPEGLEEIGYGCFDHVHFEKLVTLPSTIKTIENNAFANTTLLLTRAEKAPTIGESSFSKNATIYVLPSSYSEYCYSDMWSKFVLEEYEEEEFDQYAKFSVENMENKFIIKMKAETGTWRYMHTSSSEGNIAWTSQNNLDSEWWNFLNKDSIFVTNISPGEKYKMRSSYSYYYTSEGPGTISMKLYHNAAEVEFESTSNGLWLMKVNGSYVLNDVSKGVVLIDNISEHNGWKYYLQNDSALILGYEGENVDLTIPSQIEDHAVFGIAPYAFANAHIHSVAMPETVTMIGESAFNNSKIENVSLSSNIKRLDSHSFFGCRNLKEIILPEGLEYLDHQSLDYCDIKELYFPSSLKSFASTALPNSLENVYVNEENEHFCSIDGIVYSMDNGQLTSLDLVPDNNKTEVLMLPPTVSYVRSTGGNLKVLYLNPNIKSISAGWAGAFTGNKLTDVYFYTPISNVWGDVYCNFTCHVPIGYKEVYQNDRYLKDHTIIDDVKVDAKKLTLKKKEITAYPNNKVFSETIFWPEATTIQDVEWQSTDTTVVRVDQTGAIMTVAPGTAYIIAISVDNPTAKDSCYVTVEPRLITDINIAKEKSIYIGDRILLTPTITPSTATNKTLKWYSDDESIATVDSLGTVTSHKVGVANITCATTDGTEITKTCKITVLPIDEDIISGSCGDNLTWTLDKKLGLLKIEGTGEITDYSKGGAPWIPYQEFIQSIQILDGVTSIGNWAFHTCQKFTSITLPESITRIGEWAFCECRSLNSITLPSNTRWIDENAFAGCVKLTSIFIPQNVENIGIGTFKSCLNLASISVDENNANYASVDGVLFNKSMNQLNVFPVNKKIITYVIPESVTSIGDEAFYNCSALTSITIPSSVTSIGSSAFRGCSSLTSITIPEGVTSISDGAFTYCSKLTSVTIPNSVTSIGGSVFHSCYSLTSINIPEGVTSIGDWAFYGCSKLTSVILPENISNLGDNTFANCKNLTDITCPSTTPPSISSNTFTTYGFLHVMMGYGDVYRKSGFWKNFEIVEDIISDFACGVLGDSLTWTFNANTGLLYIEGCGRFEGFQKTAAPWHPFNKMITNIQISEGIDNIGDFAFYDCVELTNVTLPTSITEFGEGAFAGCEKLSQLELPEEMTNIGASAFSGCASLTNIVIPSSVTCIESFAFFDCPALTVIFTGELPNIKRYAFSDRTLNFDFSVKKIIVPICYYRDYAGLTYSEKTKLYPAGDILFEGTPSREEIQEKLSHIDKSTLTSITFVCDNLCEEHLTKDVISDLNPNCLIYVSGGCTMTGSNLVKVNGGKNYSCGKLTLTDGYAFTSPCTIDCQEVEYVHHPSVWANGKSGWETLCLPFSPTSIRASESGYLSPIVLGGNGNFWLRKYVGSSSTSVFFTSTADGVIEANTPYLVAFPGESMGAGHLEGETITFSASNVAIDASADPEPITKNAFIFKSTFNTTPDSKPGYELNAEGSSFVQSATVGTKPFQAYFTNDELTAESSVKSLRIDFGTFNDETGIFEVEEGSGMQAGTAGTFYDLSGRRISQGSAQQKGIYISNGRKVIKL